MNKSEFQNYIDIIYKIVEYYRTNGDLTLSEIKVKNNEMAIKSEIGFSRKWSGPTQIDTNA